MSWEPCLRSILSLNLRPPADLSNTLKGHTPLKKEVISSVYQQNWRWLTNSWEQCLLFNNEATCHLDRLNLYHTSTFQG